MRQARAKECRTNVAAFASCLTAWLRGDDGIDQDAGAHIFAETLLLLNLSHRKR